MHCPLHIEEEAGLGLGPVWRFWRGDKLKLSAGIQTSFPQTSIP